MSTAIAERREAQEPILFSVTEKTIAESFAGYMKLKVNGIDDKAGLATVKSARMDVVHARTSVEKTKTKMNEEAQKQIKRNGAEAKKLLDLLAPIEAHLLAQQTAVEVEIARIKQEKEDALFEVRSQRMQEVGGSLSDTAMRFMTEIEFEGELDKARVAKVQRERAAAEEAEAAHKRDLERQAEEARNKAERERLAAERAELERMRAEQAAIQKAEQDKLDAIRREQQAAQAKIDAEKKRIADAEAAKLRAAEIEKAKVEAAERARVETEQRLAREAKAKADRDAADEAARIRAEKLRPAKERLLAFANSVEQLAVPDIWSHDDAPISMTAVHDCLSRAADEIRAMTEKIK